MPARRTPSSKKTAALAPSPVEPKVPYFNRELSWLAFNRRVLDMALSESTPLLERVKFLSIVSSNLDEFFEIRVAGLIQQVDSEVTEPSLDGIGPREQLKRIHLAVGELVTDQYTCWHKKLVPALRSEGIVFKTGKDLSRDELRWVKEYFRAQVYPVLTPLAIDAAHPFPQLSNKSLNVVVTVDNPDTPIQERFLAILPVPRILPRVVEIAPSGKKQNRRFTFLSEIIKLCAQDLFGGFHVVDAHAFRITRNSDLYIDDEESENLLKKIEEQLRNLRRGAAVRLEVEEGINEKTHATLCSHLSLSREYVFRINGPINLSRLMAVHELIDRPDLKYPDHSPVRQSPRHTKPSAMFSSILKRDSLLHHPYESFDPVVEFVQNAARDPEVLAIKQTLYRTSGDSPIVHALIEASQNGKQVTALIELKARFDEANNINWARQMEDAGVHVVYGVVGLKIHSKCCLVVRRDGKIIRHYAHIGTGNYNPRTAKIYTDLSLFTARQEITEEVASLFNNLTSFAHQPRFQKLLVAPFNLHESIQALILNEAEAAREGKPARIIAKMNSLVDQSTIDNLYAASQAGVQIDLIIRGVCCLVPGVPGISENIRVRSIVGRFLEHSRIAYFENHGATPRIYVGSADWMPRNFFRRVEVMFPIEDPALRQRIINDILPVELEDNMQARQLMPDGSYPAVEKSKDAASRCAQQEFIKKARR